MTAALIALIPVLVLVLTLAFPIIGCVGEDPEVAYQKGKEEEAKKDAEQHAKEDEQKKQDDTAAREQRQYTYGISHEPDIVSYWRLSEGESGDATAKDSAPDTPKDGQYKNVAGGGVSRGVPGILSLVNDPTDKAALFDGAKGYVEIPHDVLINPPLEFSVEAWIRPEGPLTAKSQVVLGSYEMDGTGKVIRGFVLDVFNDPTTGSSRVRARIGFGTDFTSLEASLESGAEHDGWRHLVVTYNVTSKALMLYVNSDNGVPDAQAPGSPPVFYVANQGSPFRIGAGLTETPAPGPAPASFFNGRIDEVALYRVPLSGAQVKDHFQRATALIA